MNTPVSPALIRDTLQPAAPLPDRLPPMLFIAAVFHAIVILGVTFDTSLDFGDQAATTLDVVILAAPDQFIDSPEDAAYLAQVNQDGGGNTTDKVPASAALRGVSEVPELTEMLGDFVPETTVGEQQPDPVVTGSSPMLALTPAADELLGDVAEARPASAMPVGTEETLPLPSAADQSQLIHDDEVRELVLSVDTRESELAGYLAHWKARVEKIGTDYYNHQTMSRDHVGSPTIEVAIGARGELREIVLRRSSGSSLIDQAALGVLRRAAPYDPIPAPLAKKFDVLRFQYKFEFRYGGRGR